MYPISVYKKLEAKDLGYVPFNTNKQYTWNTSASAYDNGVRFFSCLWTSESVSLYSSESSHYGGDVKNIGKYYQIDHLFYKDFKRDINNRFGDWHYLNQKRALYKNVNVISIPAGHYGYSVKKGTFYIEDNFNNIVVDDSKGNLIISGTNMSNYNTDIRDNVLNLGPVKGFKKYDLKTYDGYVKVDGHKAMHMHWRRGKSKLNPPTYYNSFDHLDEYDDSYFFNPIKYKDVTFSPKHLFTYHTASSPVSSQVSTGSIEIENNQFPAIDFNGESSEVKLGNSEKFNFNKGDDFTVAFWLSASPTSNSTGSLGKQYVISKSTTKTIESPTTTQTGTDVNTTTTGALQPREVPAEPQYPFEIYVADDIVRQQEVSTITFAAGTINTASFYSASAGATGSVYLSDSNGNQFTLIFTGSVHSAMGSPVPGLSGSATLVHLSPDLGSGLGLGTDGVAFMSSSVLALSAAAAINTAGTLISASFSASVESNVVTITTRQNGDCVNVSQTLGTLNLTTATTTEGQIINGQHVYFSRSDGGVITTYSSSFKTGSTMQHIACRASDSSMEIFINGKGSGTSGSDNSQTHNQNNANLYIGNKGGVGSVSASCFLTGSLSQINIYESALSNDQIVNHYSSSNGSPYVGNIFYSQGIATITHPAYWYYLAHNPSMSSSLTAPTIPYGGPDESSQYGFDISSQLVYSGKSKDVDDEVATSITGMYFNTSGTTMYLLDGSGVDGTTLSHGIIQGATNQDLIHQYTLSTPWDVSTAAFSGSSPTLFSASYVNTVPNVSKIYSGMTMDPEGKKVFLFASSGSYLTSSLLQLELNEPFQIGSGFKREQSTITFAAGTINTASFYSASAGATGSIYLFDDDGNQHTIAFTGSVHSAMGSPVPGLSGSLTQIHLSPDLGSGNGLGADGVAFMSASVLAESTSKAINSLDNFSSSFSSNVVTIFHDRIGNAVDISTTLGSLNLTTAAVTGSNKCIFLNNYVTGSGTGWEIKSPHTAGGPVFNNDGTKIFFIARGKDLTDNTIQQTARDNLNAFRTWEISLSTPYELDSSTTSQSRFMFSTGTSPWQTYSGSLMGSHLRGTAYTVRGMDFNHDGSQMIFSVPGLNSGDNDYLFQVYLTSSFDISTMIDSNKKAMILDSNDEPGSGTPDAIRWEEADTGSLLGTNARIYVAGFGINEVVLQYEISGSKLEKIEYQGNHMIYEHEYQCTAEVSEFNDTTNITARKIKSFENDQLAGFATGSNFKPYVTTIGLFNEENELLVIGKLGQPIRMSDETDTTFIVRFDT